MSRWLLRKEITRYLEDYLQSDKDGVVLVAMLEPVDNGDQDTYVKPEGYLQPMFRSFPSAMDEEEASQTVPELEDMRPAPAKTISTVFSSFRMEIDEDKERSLQRVAEPAEMDAFEEAFPSQVGSPSMPVL